MVFFRPAKVKIKTHFFIVFKIENTLRLQNWMQWFFLVKNPPKSLEYRARSGLHILFYPGCFFILHIYSGIRIYREWKIHVLYVSVGAKKFVELHPPPHETYNGVR